eukprot:TRINITY_DN8322_c1_g1_i1.p5 TRINITY_DN8322_c1_g1~~TRINITY_DN8322_c1_g1_i1.p5  ORF type:complete len:141 (-),score=21.31 TRINITY_DN8322_c1_g1_i1:584-1006(-)
MDSSQGNDAESSMSGVNGPTIAGSVFNARTFVYESKCRACCGTGMIASGSSRSRRHVLYTCPSCLGLGYVRRTTTRFVPPLNGNENEGGVMTLGRDVESQRTPQNGFLNGNGHSEGKFHIDQSQLDKRRSKTPKNQQNGQ